MFYRTYHHTCIFCIARRNCSLFLTDNSPFVLFPSWKKGKLDENGTTFPRDLLTTPTCCWITNAATSTSILQTVHVRRLAYITRKNMYLGCSLFIRWKARLYLYWRNVFETTFLPILHSQVYFSHLPKDTRSSGINEKEICECEI